MPTYIALLRGINVGRAKRVAMADLRQVVAELGYTNVRTLLNSGNVVFDSARKVPASAAGTIRDAIADRTGVTSEVTVISAADLDAIISEYPLSAVVTNPSRCLVAFPSTVAELAKASALLQRDWAPEQFALGTRTAYLWCSEGILGSTLGKVFGQAMRDKVTTRNWTTVLKLHEMSQPGD
jgi:uncharacterized protein (DUF1697 family)